jgi:aerobic-type carbon monoxide dehydrogenase small subunit (CoxS/CutS family)
MARVTKIHLNGRESPVDADSERSLLSVLRDDLALTGSKYGCGEGQCGACTVLVDGHATRSCRTRIGHLDGKKVQTIEGLAKDGKLHPVQQAFLDADAFQCGYCTCGMILSAVALLDTHPDPTDEQIVTAMNGNICRCGGYNNIRAAIRKAAETLRNLPK